MGTIKDKIDELSLQKDGHEKKARELSDAIQNAVQTAVIWPLEKKLPRGARVSRFAYDTGGGIRLELEFFYSGEPETMPPKLRGEELYTYILGLASVRDFVDGLAKQGITIKYDDFARFELCSGK